MRRKDFVFYIGYAGRKIKAEYMRWCCNQKYPVISELNGDNIKMAKATHELGFKAITLHADRIMLNATGLEKAIHVLAKTMMSTLAEPTLWRYNGMGANDDSWRLNIFKKSHKVFLTWSWKARKAIRKKEIKVNQNKKKTIKVNRDA